MMMNLSEFPSVGGAVSVPLVPPGEANSFPDRTAPAALAQKLSQWKQNPQGIGALRILCCLWNFPDLQSSPPNGGEFRSGNVTVLLFTGSNAVTCGALPALSCQVWKCIVSVGPILIRIRNTSTLEARCAIDG